MPDDQQQIIWDDAPKKPPQGGRIPAPTPSASPGRGGTAPTPQVQIQWDNPSTPESGLSRGLSGVGRGLRNIGEGLVGTAKLGMEVAGPIGEPKPALQGLIQGSADEFGKAKDAMNDPYLKGAPVSKALAVGGHALAGALPGVGPWAASMGEQIGKGAGSPEGDVIGPVMEAATTIGAPSLLHDAWGAAEPARNKLAEALETPTQTNTLGAERQAEKYGHSGERAARGEGFVGATSKGLAAQAKSRLGEIGQAIGDTLNQPANAGKVFDREPIIDSAYQKALQRAKQSGHPELEGQLNNIRDAYRNEFGPTQNSLALQHQAAIKISQDTDFSGNPSADKVTNQFRQEVSRGMRDEIKKQINNPQFNQLMQRYGDASDALKDYSRNALKEKDWTKGLNIVNPLSVVRKFGKGPLTLAGRIIGSQYPFPEAAESLPLSAAEEQILQTGPSPYRGQQFGSLDEARRLSVDETRPPRTADLSDVALSDRGGVIRRQPFAPNARGLALPSAPSRLMLNEPAPRLGPSPLDEPEWRSGAPTSGLVPQLRNALGQGTDIQIPPTENSGIRTTPAASEVQRGAGGKMQRVFTSEPIKWGTERSVNGQRMWWDGDKWQLRGKK